MDPDEFSWLSQLMPKKEVDEILSYARVDENTFDFNYLNFDSADEGDAHLLVETVVSPERPFEWRNQHTEHGDAAGASPIKKYSKRNPNILSRNNRHNQEPKPIFLFENLQNVPIKQPILSERQPLIRNIEDDSQYDDPEFQTTLECAQYKFVNMLRELKKDPYSSGMIAYVITRSAAISDKASNPFVQKLIETINTYPYRNETDNNLSSK